MATCRTPRPVRRGLRQGMHQLLVAVLAAHAGLAALFWVRAGCALARSGARGACQVLEP